LCTGRDGKKQSRQDKARSAESHGWLGTDLHAGKDVALSPYNTSRLPRPTPPSEDCATRPAKV
jgi:hypothetical protein